VKNINNGEQADDFLWRASRQLCLEYLSSSRSWFEMFKRNTCYKNWQKQFVIRSLAVQNSCWLMLFVYGLMTTMLFSIATHWKNLRMVFWHNKE